MFVALESAPGSTGVQLVGPYHTFAEVVAVSNRDAVHLVIEWLPPVGWICIWELQGDRYEAIIEASAPELLRQKAAAPRKSGGVE